MVERTQRLIRGFEPQALQDDNTHRQQLGNLFTSVQTVLDGLLIDLPRRSILRR